ncbi:MAG: precorrin-4 C(11)-methyltransferase [Candidatus Nezhaarchaeales archaeon]
MKGTGKVYIVGAGPGDPELITIKGRKLLEEADVVIYTGSLINPDILKYTKKGAKLYDSSKMCLEEIVQRIVEAVEGGKMVVRLHDGDPSLYGAHRELVDELERLGVECVVVPGVSSLQAAAACLKVELTLPGVSQTVIITRPEGRTPVTEADNMIELAKHRATMAIFLGVQRINEVVQKLIAGGYPEDTPVAVVYKASWPDQKVIRGKLSDISSKVEAEGIKSTAIILVGEAIEPKTYSKSKLYSKNFTHSFRRT